MIRIVELEESISERLAKQSDGYGLNPRTIIKCIGLQLYKTWYPYDEKEEKIQSWREFCRQIEQTYGSQSRFEDDAFTFSVDSPDRRFRLLIENTTADNQILDAMEAAMHQLADYLAGNSWENKISCIIPEEQLRVREQVNSTDKDIPPNCLHAEFFRNADRYPNTPALAETEIDEQKIITYGQLRERALRVSALLQKQGVQKGTSVAVVLPKGAQQIVAVLGILSVGGVYVPIGIGQPFDRVKKILETAQIRYILTDRLHVETYQYFSQTNRICIDDQPTASDGIQPIFSDPRDTAYIIFTSGSTGDPKGVEISHESAYNTIADINKRFGVDEKDCLLAISELDFDLSVYDIFGLLAAGGKIVVLSEKSKKEPAVWKEAIKKNDITIWNSVPMFFEMLLTIWELTEKKLPLRLVMLSGDWIKLELYHRVKETTEHCRFVALGGATEASIWSNYFEVQNIPTSWKSIPYGVPLSNQKMRILDSRGFDCPDYVVGELWIGGKGVAKGYVNREDLTEDSFQNIDGISWYRTGDLARYWSDGTIEFLGRIDNQVKINGFRIELGEIENIAKQHPDVEDAIAVAIEAKGSKKLALAVIPRQDRNNVFQCEVTEDDVSDWSDDMLSVRTELVESFLLELCQLSDIASKSYDTAYCERTKTLFDYWCHWLQRRRVINIDHSKIRPGERYDSVLSRNSIERDELALKLTGVKDLFKRILQGDESAVQILDVQGLSPEELSMEGDDTKHCIRIITGMLEERGKDSLKIAMLGARTGLGAYALYQEVENPYSQMTLFDSSPIMLNKARTRFKNNENIKFEILTEEFIPREHLHAYDYVIAISSLHQYIDARRGIGIAYTLLKEEGHLFAIEYEKLDPIAVVVSGAIENGFINFSNTRETEDKPLLTKKEWQDVFAESQFAKLKIISRYRSSAMLIDAALEKAQFNSPAVLKEYLQLGLAEYMLPDSICFFLSFPINKNGKVDRKKMVRLITGPGGQAKGKIEYVGLEGEIADIWKTLIGCDQITGVQSFFEIGGDSLSATRFITILKQRMGVDYSLRELFDRPGLSEVAFLVQKKIDELKSMVEGEL